jgi:dihydropteroate synthase
MNFNAGKYSLPLGKRTYIMAVVNLTPDSFYQGSRTTAENAKKRAVELVGQGADIIDLGAQSTAPNSTPISAVQELERLLAPLREIRQAVDVPISVDTFFPAVAKAALELGADIINDVSGTACADMARLAGEYGAGWIVMHTGGKVSSEAADYPSGVISDINSFFKTAVQTADNHSLDRSRLCLDPGIGFGKTRENDLEIIRNFRQLDFCGCAALAALSRKRVTRLCTDALIGTTVADTACILGGADIVRVHDVREAAAAAKMADLILRGNING